MTEATQPTAALPRPRGLSLERLFGVHAAGSTIPREVIAGFTTFAAMSYVIVVNPSIVSAAGMDRNSLIIATAIASMAGTLLMGLTANLPVALAPGMGSNVVFAQVVVLQLGVSWQTALAIIFVDAVLFTVLALSRWREKIVAGFPDSIKLGIQCGIGLFIAYLGLKGGGVVTVSAHGIGLGSLSEPSVMLAFLGVILTPVLIAMRLKGALLVSIILITIAGIFVPAAGGHGMVTPLPAQPVALPRFPTELLFAYDFKGFAQNFLLLLPVTIYFFVSDFFSATSTLIGVTRRANLTLPDGSIPNARPAFAADAFASVIGASVGVPTVAAYVESVAGVEAGGRTGLTAVVTALLFGLALFFWPLIAIIPAQATAPALVMVGVMMMEGIRDLDPSKPEDCFPPILILLVTVATANLMAGMATGCFVHTLMLAATRQWRRITPMLLLIDAVLVIYFIVAAGIK